MPSQHSARLLLLASAALLAACGAGGTGVATPQSSATPRAENTPPSLPFHYSAAGESSSPTFHVASAGTYTVAYTITGSAEQPDCTVSIGLVADDGDSRQVLGGIKLAPPDSKQGTVPLQLTAGNWRFQEGGGCGWQVSVTAG